jgi:hypothetical protein
MKKTIVTVVFELKDELSKDQTLNTIDCLINSDGMLKGETYNVVDIDVIEE